MWSGCVIGVWGGCVIHNRNVGGGCLGEMWCLGREYVVVWMWGVWCVYVGCVVCVCGVCGVRMWGVFSVCGSCGACIYGMSVVCMCGVCDIYIKLHPLYIIIFIVSSTVIFLCCTRYAFPEISYEHTFTPIQYCSLHSPPPYSPSSSIAPTYSL